MTGISLSAGIPGSWNNYRMNRIVSDGEANMQTGITMIWTIRNPLVFSHSPQEQILLFCKAGLLTYSCPDAFPADGQWLKIIGTVLCP